MNPLPLPEDEGHVWYAPLRDRPAEAWERLREQLRPEDRGRVERMRQVPDQRVQIATRHLVRRVLSSYFEVTPEAWTFEVDEYGRPRISGPIQPTGFDFNLSHTRELVACAVARGCRVGLDVERIEDSRDLRDLARVCFTAKERDGLEALAPASRAHRFFQLWTLKEAYLKARGLGLQLPLQGFEFDVDGPKPTIGFPGIEDDPAAWQFVVLQLDPRHAGAVAFQGGAGPDRRVIARELSLSA